MWLVLGWTPYSRELQQTIEQKYASGIKRFDVTIGGVEYEIDLASWKQINTQDRTKTRGIKLDGPRLENPVAKRRQQQSPLINYSTDFQIPGLQWLMAPFTRLGNSGTPSRLPQANNVSGYGKIYANAGMTANGANVNAGMSLKFVWVATFG